MSVAPTYMIAGGGTGGHIFPAVAIAEALQAQVPGARIVFVGTRYGMEMHLIPELGYPLLTLPIRGLLGKHLKQKLALLWRLPTSLLLSFWFLLRYRPKVVVGVGGYASGPLIWTAWLLRFPTMIQEQNAFPGLTNRLNAKLVKLACLGFPEAGKRLACPSIATGNPIRGTFSNSEAWTATRKTILILGGSQGARALNQALPPQLKTVLAGQDVKVIHQCGAAHVDAVKAAYGAVNFELEVTPFIADLAGLMNHVLLVICRSGASTVSELKQVGVPAILVPFPQATHNHQTFNARHIADLGAALLLPEQEIAQAGEQVRQLLAARDTKLAAMAKAYPAVKANAAQTCAQIVRLLEQRRPVPQIIEEFRHVS